MSYPKGRARGNSCTTRLANTKLVRKSIQTNETTTSTPAGEQDFTDTTITPERDPPDVAETKPHGLSLIWESLDRYSGVASRPI